MGTFTQDNKSAKTKQADASKVDTSKAVADDKAKVATREIGAEEDKANLKVEVVDKPVTDDKSLPEKDAPVGDQGVKEAEAEIPADTPNKPTAILDESAEETRDRHEASEELGVQEVTDPETQADTEAALEAGTKVVPGAAAGPDVAGVVRNDDGNVAYAPPGTLDAAMNGVQEDASGHVSSIHTDNGNASGVRV